MDNQNRVGTGKFGTFLGVFLPSILTVLGLVLYLRLGWVLGNLGLGFTLLMVLMSAVITVITGLSASAIATNIKLGVGGVYYLVSRSLGLETGGAIGVAFYISRTLSITFYAYGLSESILIFWPAAWGQMPGYLLPVFSAFLIVLIAVMAGRSVESTLKLQIPIFILVALSLLALAGGVLSGPLQAPAWSPARPMESVGFWAVLAVFFPGVTGFLTGVALSGDLKDPERSIPRGGIASILAGAFIYLIVPVFLAVSGKLTYDQLANPDFGLNTWTEVALLGGLLVYPAAWGAILASALASMLSAPRLLQSLSMDGLAPRFLSKLSNNGQPVTAILVTAGLALIAVALGDLNTVAKFVTVIFLTLYVVINLVAAIEKLVAEPSYRPKIDVPWYLSMSGAVGALLIMYFISPPAMLLAVGLELTFYIYFRRKALEQQWGDVNAGFWMKIARFALLRMSKRQIKARNWRPLMLVFVKDIKERIELVKLAASFGQNRGILSVSKLLFMDDHAGRARRKEICREMQQDLQVFGLEAFCEVNIVSSLNRGILTVSKGHGIAGLKTNTIVFGWSGNRAGNEEQLKIIRNLSIAGENILLVKFNDHDSWKEKKHDRIDIWWGGRESNGDLMLIFAYLLKLNREWEKARIVIRAIVDSPAEQQALSRRLEFSLTEAHIPATVDILLRDEEGFSATLRRESAGADLVFLGLKVTPEGEEAEHAAKLEELGSVAKTVVFVQNNSVSGSLPVLLGGLEERSS